jgi:glycosyltransferase involved in cell wall biosynthesis
MSKKLHLFWPSTVRRCRGEYFVKRPWFFNELPRHFDVSLYASVKEVNQVDERKYQGLDSDLDVVDFFAELSLTDVLLRYRRYERQITEKTNPEEDFYMVFYPYRKASVVLAHMLSDYRLAIWIKSDYVGLFGLPDAPPISSIIKKTLKPAVRFGYPRLTQRILESNVVFYTGDIIYDTQNHINQHGITSVSPLNENERLITEPYDNSIVFVGDEGEQKGLRYLLEALVKCDIDVSLTIVGLEELSMYRSYHEQLDITVAGVIYDRDEFFAELAAHDALVMPSICERQGKVQLEAMSAGVVPICSDSGGTYTTVSHLHNGLLFRERDSDHLREMIERLYADEQLYTELQQNGLSYASELDLSEQVEKMASITKRYYE